MSQTSQDFSVLDNISRARLNMIESQIRAGGVTSRKVLAAMAGVQREIFIENPDGALAYAEIDAKVQNSDRCLLNPLLLARLIDAADIHDGDLVLDIGCANGYSTAILADLVNIGTVIGLEVDESLIAQANHLLEMLGKSNIVIEQGNLNEGYPPQAPYDVIIINGASAIPPNVLEEVFVPQLRMNGRFVGVFDDSGDIKGEAWRWTKTESGVLYETLFDARPPILPGFESLPISFKFPGIKPKESFVNPKPELSPVENDGQQGESKWQENEKKLPLASESDGESKEAGLPAETTKTEKNTMNIFSKLPKESEEKLEKKSHLAKEQKAEKVSKNNMSFATTSSKAKDLETSLKKESSLEKELKIPATKVSEQESPQLKTETKPAIEALEPSSPSKKEEDLASPSQSGWSSPKVLTKNINSFMKQEKKEKKTSPPSWSPQQKENHTSAIKPQSSNNSIVKTQTTKKENKPLKDESGDGI